MSAWVLFFNFFRWISELVNQSNFHRTRVILFHWVNKAYKSCYDGAVLRFPWWLWRFVARHHMWVYVQPEDLPQKRRRNRSKEDIEVSQLSMVLKFFSFIQQLTIALQVWWFSEAFANQGGLLQVFDRSNLFKLLFCYIPRGFFFFTPPRCPMTFS